MKKQDPDRTHRLSAALRANLRRRKGQARDQATGPAAQEPAGDPDAIAPA